MGAGGSGGGRRTWKRVLARIKPKEYKRNYLRMMAADVKDLPVGVRLLGVHEIGGCCSPLPRQQGKSRGRGG